jgi:hypothetical protein
VISVLLLSIVISVLLLLSHQKKKDR